MDTRSRNESSPAAPTIIRTSQDLRLPRWVNKLLPDLRALLSASEISHLTRRPRWLLLGLAVLGRFPKQRTHCGKAVNVAMDVGATSLAGFGTLCPCGFAKL